MSDGGYLWYQEDDVHIGQRMAIEKYEPYLTQLFKRHLTRGAKVVDVGANIGHYSLAAARIIGKKGKVWVLEPEANNFEILKKNLDENRIKNVEAVKAAVGRNEGVTRIIKSKENFGDHRVGGKTGEAVKLISLDKLLGGQKIDVIKIDVQGWEPEVIAGTKTIIGRDRPTIIMEFCPIMMKEARTDSNQMWKFLEKIYGSIWVIDENVNTYKKVRFDEAVRLANNPTASVNLIMLSNIDVRFIVNRILDIGWKKLIKKMWDNLS